MWAHPTTIIGFHKDCSTRIHTLIMIRSDNLVAEGHVITAQTGFPLVCSKDKWICNVGETSLTVQAGAYILLSQIISLFHHMNTEL